MTARAPRPELPPSAKRDFATSIASVTTLRAAGGLEILPAKLDEVGLDFLTHCELGQAAAHVDRHGVGNYSIGDGLCRHVADTLRKAQRETMPSDAIPIWWNEAPLVSFGREQRDEVFQRETNRLADHFDVPILAITGEPGYPNHHRDNRLSGVLIDPFPERGSERTMTMTVTGDMAASAVKLPWLATTPQDIPNETLADATDITWLPATQRPTLPGQPPAVDDASALDQFKAAALKGYAPYFQQLSRAVRDHNNRGKYMPLEEQRRQLAGRRERVAKRPGTSFVLRRIDARLAALKRQWLRQHDDLAASVRTTVGSHGR